MALPGWSDDFGPLLRTYGGIYYHQTTIEPTKPSLKIFTSTSNNLKAAFLYYINFIANKFNFKD
jgi:hypothetical protein